MNGTNCLVADIFSDDSLVIAVDCVSEGCCHQGSGNKNAPFCVHMLPFGIYVWPEKLSGDYIFITGLLGIFYQRNMTVGEPINA